MYYTVAKKISLHLAHVLRLCGKLRLKMAEKISRQLSVLLVAWVVQTDSENQKQKAEL